jgi:hypothetical protein
MKICRSLQDDLFRASRAFRRGTRQWRQAECLEQFCQTVSWEVSSVLGKNARRAKRGTSRRILRCLEDFLSSSVRQANLRRVESGVEARNFRGTAAAFCVYDLGRVFAPMTDIVPNQDQTPAQQFESYRAALQREGQRLIIFIALYRRVHERRHDRLAALNVAPAFFQTVLASLHVTIVVRAHALFDAGDGSDHGLRKFLKFVSGNIGLFSLEQLAARKGWPLDHENMRNRRAPTVAMVRADRKAIARIKSLNSIDLLRNKVHAHIDAEYLADPGKAADDAPLTWADLSELRSTFEQIVNRYSSAYDASSLIFEPVNVNDVDEVVEILHQYRQRELSRT